MPNDGQFCCNGLVFPDRSPHPAYYEAAACMAPISFELAAPEGGERRPGHAYGRVRVVVRNKQSFLGMDYVQFEWRLMLLGRLGSSGGDGTSATVSSVAKPPGLIAAGAAAGTVAATPAAAAAGLGGSCSGAGLTLRDEEDGGWQLLPPLSIAPGQEATMQLPLTREEAARKLQQAAASCDDAIQLVPLPEDAVVEVRAVLSDDLPWAVKGHVVAQAQLLPLDETWVPAPPLDAHVEALRKAVAGAGAASGAAGGGGAAAGAAAGGAKAAAAALRVERSVDGGVVVSGPEGFRLAVSGATGCIESVEARGQRLVVRGLMPCLFRAGTDNDRGGSGGMSYLGRWVAAGLDRLGVEGPVEIRVVEGEGAGGQEDGGGRGEEGTAGRVVEIECSFVLRPSAAVAAAEVEGGAGVGEVGGAHWMAAEGAGEVAKLAADGDFAAEHPEVAEYIAAAVAAAAAEHPQVAEYIATAVASAAAARDGERAEGHVAVRAVYRVHPNGLVETDWKVDASDALPARLAAGLKASLPRVGLHVEVAGKLGARVAWYGRGPQECYPDRKYGAPLRRYER